MMNMFPQYMDKTASRSHAKFLFGESEQAKVFKNYKNAMQTVENKVRIVGDSMLPQDVIKNELKMFDVMRLNEYGQKVFDLKMSDFDEIQFLEQIVGNYQTANQPDLSSIDLLSNENEAQK